MTLVPARPSLGQSLRAVLIPFLVTRAALLVVVYLGLTWFPLGMDRGAWRVFPQNLWLDGWARWDSGWISSVYNEGYRFHPGGQCNVPFLPLYPHLAGLLSWPLQAWLGVGQAFAVAGMLVSHAAFLLGLAGLYRLGAQEMDEGAARRAAWLICVFPYSFYFAAVYTEGLFFALSTWAFCLAREDRWWPACLLGALCEWTRLPGFFVALALALEYGASRGFRPSRLDRQFLALLLLPASFAGLLAFYARATGDPFAFYDAQGAWGRLGASFLLRDCQRALHGPWDVRLVLTSNLVLLVAGLVGAVFVAFRLHLSWALLVGLTLGSTGHSTLEGIGRFVSVQFPLFLLLGHWLRDSRLAVPIMALSCALQWVLAWLFSNWRWVT